MPRYDAIVVGGGPAGCVASFFLLHYSGGAMKVLLLERLDDGKHPRYHRMCGEGLSARTFKDLRPLKPNAVTCDISRAIEHWPHEKSFEVKAKGYLIDRGQFLKGLMRRFEGMGGEIRQETVTGIVGRGPGFEVKCLSGRSYECDKLLGADGAHSVVRRDCFGSSPRYSLMADQYILPRKTIPDAIQFFYEARYKGAYRWEFPAGESTRVGFPTGIDERPQDPLECHRRMVVFGGVGDIARGRACLVGDAAAQTNSLTFGGLHTSMMAGKMAAEAVVSGDPEQYQRRWSSSRFASPHYLNAWLLLRDMDDEQLLETVEHVRGRITFLGTLGTFVGKERFRELYWSYFLSQYYGW